MNSIFINYRREDAAPYAGRICDRLEEAFGKDKVFQDIEDIAPGMDYIDAIENTLNTCDVLIVVIGPKWLQELKAREGRQDFVSIEIETALKKGRTIIPVLVGGAQRPARADLPVRLNALGRRQSVTIRETSFDQDVKVLVDAVKRNAGSASSLRRLVITLLAAGLFIAIAGAAVLLLRSKQAHPNSGQWIAKMQRAGMRPYDLRMRLNFTGESLTGQIDYPTGSAAIQQGSFRDGQLKFFTRHTPQFENEPVTIEGTGTVRNQEIDLTLVTPDGGETRGTAKQVQ